jgi:hypothetical protein
LQRADIAPKLRRGGTLELAGEFPPSRRAFILSLAALVALGLALRLYVLLSTGFMIDADEALVGLQASAILRGRRPLFYPGQSYGGSFESYLVAPVIWAGGTSPLILKIVPLISSLTAIPVAGWLGRTAYNRRVGVLSALLAALAPLTPLIVGLKAYGGYAQIPLLGGLALVLLIQLAEGRRQNPTLSALILGLLCGFGLWANLQFAYYLLAVALVLVLRWRAVRPAGLAAFLAGLIPGLLVLLGGSLLPASPRAPMDVVPADRLWPALLDSLRHLATDALPALWGARPMKGPASPWWVWLATPVYILAVAAGAAWAIRRARYGERNPSLPLLAVLLAGIPVFVMAALTNGNYAAIIPDSGLLVRYIVPLYLPFAVLVAAFLCRLRSRSRAVSSVALILVPAIHMWSVLGADLVAQSRSPYVNVPLPASNGELIEFLEREDLRHVYASHWIGYKVAFETGERVLASDCLDRLYRADRIPAYSQAVDDAASPAYILFNPRWDRKPPLERRLNRLGVDYSREALSDFLVYYRLSPRIDPGDVMDSLVWPYW